MINVCKYKYTIDMYWLVRIIEYIITKIEERHPSYEIDCKGIWFFLFTFIW